VLVLHKAVDLLVVGHLLLARVEAEQAPLLRNLEPGVAADLVDREPRVWVGIEYLAEEVRALRGEKFGYLVVSSEDLLVEVRCLGVLEGQVPADHGKEDYAAAPNVTFEPSVTLSCYHL